MTYWFVIYSGDNGLNIYKNQAERFDTDLDAQTIKRIYEKFDWITEIYVAKEVKQMKHKGISCPQCHGEGGEWGHEFWDYCQLCKGDRIISQELRMKWVRSFKGLKK